MKQKKQKKELKIIYDIIPPTIKKGLVVVEEVEKKISIRTKAFYLFLKTSKYGLAVLVLGITLLGGTLIMSFSPKIERTEIYPAQYKGDWQNIGMALDRDLSDKANISEFDHSNSVSVVESKENTGKEKQSEEVIQDFEKGSSEPEIENEEIQDSSQRPGSMEKDQNHEEEAAFREEMIKEIQDFKQEDSAENLEPEEENKTNSSAQEDFTQNMEPTEESIEPTENPELLPIFDISLPEPSESLNEEFSFLKKTKDIFSTPEARAEEIDLGSDTLSLSEGELEGKKDIDQSENTEEEVQIRDAEQTENKPTKTGSQDVLSAQEGSRQSMKLADNEEEMVQLRDTEPTEEKFEDYSGIIIVPDIDGNLFSDLKDDTKEEAEAIFTKELSAVYSDFSVSEKSGELKKIRIGFSFASFGEENEDDEIIVLWSLDDQGWNTASEFVLNKNYSNKNNDGYFYADVFDLSDLDRNEIIKWKDVENIKVKFSYLTNNNENDHVPFFLDAVWLEAKSEKLDEELENDKEERIEILSQKKDFKVDEDLEFKFKYEKERTGLLDSLTSIAETIGIIDYWKDINLIVEIIAPDGEIFKVPSEEFGNFSEIFTLDKDGGILMKLKKDRRFKPGFYKIILKIEEGGEAQTFEQDFTWGVLTINVNKSIYLSGEEAYLQMGVLRNDGHTICDAGLELRIKNYKLGIETLLSTEDGTIQYSGQCSGNNVTDVPDYFAYYQIGDAGTYEMKLTNLSNGYEIIDSFEVRDFVPFDVERIGPSRIYPPADYEMVLKIKANEDFVGEIIETVPEGFVITNVSLSVIARRLNERSERNADVAIPLEESAQEGSTQSMEPTSFTEAGMKYKIQDTNDNRQTLIFQDINLKTDDELEIRYTFNAPDISPYLYLLGPLEVGGWQEVRQWQIALDDTTGNVHPSAYTLTTGFNGNFNDASYPASNAYSSNGTYASTGFGVKRNHEYATNYRGFDFSGIPDGSTITSVNVYIERKVDVANGVAEWKSTVWSDVTITAALEDITGSGSIGDTQYVTSTNPTSDAYWNYSMTTLPSVAQLKGANFGIRVQIDNNNNGTECEYFIDDIYIVVNYDLPGITVSGRVCSAEPCNDTNGSGACATASVVGLSVNGGTPTHASCNTTTGAYSFADVTAISGATIMLFLNDNAADASAVVVSDGNAISDGDFYDDTVVIRSQTGTATIADMMDYDSDQQTGDIRFDAETGVLNVEAGHELHIWTGDTFAPGGTVILVSGAGSDLHLDDNSTFTAGGAISIGGSWIADAGSTFTHNDNTVTFTAGVSGQTIATNAQNFYNLIFNGSSGAWSFILATADVDNDFTITNGTVTAPSTTLTVGGSYSNAGTFTHNDGTVLMNDAVSDGTETLTGAMTTTSSFYDLTFNSANGPWTFAANSATVANDLTITAGTVTAPSTALDIGVDFVNNGTFTHNSGTVDFIGTVAQAISGSSTTAFNDLTVTNASAAVSSSVNFDVAGTMNMSGSNTLLTPTATVIINDTATQGILTGTGTVQVTGVTGTNDFATQYEFTTKTLTNLTVDFIGATTGQQIDALTTYSNLKIRPAANSITANFASGTVTVSGDLGIGNGTNTGVIVTVATNDPNISVTDNVIVDADTTLTNSDSSSATLNIDGNLTITGVFTAPIGTTATSFTLAGDFTNNGTFAANSGTMTFDGVDSSIQTLVGNTTFNNFTASTSGNSTGRTLKFTDGSTQTVSGTWTITGYSGKIITLTRSSTTSAWTINPTVASVTYANVSWSNSGLAICATYSTDGGNNNADWSFSDGDTCESGVTISGTVRQTDESTPQTGANGVTVTIISEGQSPTTTTVQSDGTYSKADVTIGASGNAILVYLDDDATYKGSVVTVANDTTSSIENLDIFQDRIIATSNKTATNITNQDFVDVEQSGDTDDLYSISGLNVTVGSGYEFHIYNSKNYVPGGTLTTQGATGDLHLDDNSTINFAANAVVISGDVMIDNSAVFTAPSSTLTIGENYSNSGTFTHNGGTVDFNKGSATQTLNSGGTGAGKLFNDLTHSGVGTLQLSTNAIDIDGDFSQTAGIFDANGLNQNFAGNFSLSDTTAYTKGGTLTFDGTTSYNDTNSDTKENIGIVVASGTSVTLASSMTVDKMNVSAGILDLVSSGYTLTFSGTGTGASRPFIVSGTLNEGTDSTVIFNGSSADTDIEDETYDNLNLSPSAGAGTNYHFNAGTITTDNLVIGNGTNEVTVNAGTYNPIIDINGDVTINNVGTFIGGSANITIGTDGQPKGDLILESGSIYTAGSGILILDGGADDDQVIFWDKNGTKQNMGTVQIGASPATINLSSDMTANSLTVSVGDKLNTRGYDLDIATYITINGTLNATQVISGNGTNINLGTDWTVAVGGAFTAEESETYPTTVIFDGTSASSLTPGGTDESHDFYNLQIAKTSAATVTLQGAIDVENNLTISNSNSTLDTKSGSDHGINVGGNWTNSGTFTANSGTVTFDAVDTGNTITDGGDPFNNITFNGTNGGWTYQNGSSTAPAQTTVTNGTSTYINAKTGAVSVTGGTLNVDWYLGVHAVNRNGLGDINTDGDNDIIISENTGTPASTVWKYNSGWGVAASSQTTGTDATGINPQPNSDGAIRIREYSNADGTPTYYSYNLQIVWQTSYGQYDYYDDYTGAYITSFSNSGTIDDGWYRSLALIDTMNTPYDTVNTASNQGSWYVGMLTGLSVDITTGTSITFDNLDLVNNFSDTDETKTKITVSTSATNGYVVTAWEDGLMTCAACPGTPTIQNFYGTYAVPQLWSDVSYCKDNSNYCGFGFTSSDTTIEGSDLYVSGTKYAGFPNDAANPIRVMDYDSPANGEDYDITYRISVSPTQQSGDYSTTVVYVVTAEY